MSVADDLEILVDDLGSIRTDLSGIREDFGVHKEVQRKHKNLTLWLAFVLFCIGVLSINLIFWSFEVQRAQDDIKSTSCDLYGLFIGSLQDPDPSQIDTPEKRAEFEEAASVILSNYAQLGCVG